MSTGSVKIMCPKLTCRKILAVPEVARGKTVRCKACGTCIKVPAKTTEAANPAKPAEA